MEKIVKAGAFVIAAFLGIFLAFSMLQLYIQLFSAFGDLSGTLKLNN